MKLAEALRARWGGGIRPSINIDRDSFVERWDGEGEGRATCVTWEAFGFTGFFLIGRTPAKRKDEE